MFRLLPFLRVSNILMKIPIPGNERGLFMKRFDALYGRAAFFLAVLILGMLVPTRAAFAQG